VVTTTTTAAPTTAAPGNGCVTMVCPGGNNCYSEEWQYKLDNESPAQEFAAQRPTYLSISTHTLEMIDTYGDGWQGGEWSYKASCDDENSLVGPFTMEDDSSVVVTFSLGPTPPPTPPPPGPPSTAPPAPTTTTAAGYCNAQVKPACANNQGMKDAGTDVEIEKCCHCLLDNVCYDWVEAQNECEDFAGTWCFVSAMDSAAPDTVGPVEVYLEGTCEPQTWTKGCFWQLTPGHNPEGIAANREGNCKMVKPGACPTTCFGYETSPC
jgi:hypothetical protein